MNHPNASSPPPAPFDAPTAQTPGGPVIGVGASAGGLLALEQFFTHVPVDSGMAFVVVQHLDPGKKSLLVELLQRSCPIPVVQAEEGTTLVLNQVHVAPPGYELSLLHGVLHLLQPVGGAGRGLRLPIDAFFRSLALDQQANAAGVILSGMGGDGTLGLQALKEKAGGTFVQAPESADFQGMPRHALQADQGDVVAPAEQLPSKILAYFARTAVQPPSEQASAAMQPAVDKVLILVRAQTGHDFSGYKKTTVCRRIQRRMAIHQVDTLDDYVGYVRQNPLEAELLFKELLIGVTSFFRDPPVWEQLQHELMPKLLAAYPDGGVLRAWVAACSTGEEAYTLAMVFADVLAELRPTAQFSLQIFATDMDKDAIERARAGFYPDNIAADVPEERLARYFVKVPGGYLVSKEIRTMVIFAQQSITSDPPFAKLNILTCRNLLIYLENDVQQKLLQLFHSSLNPGGLLVLGSAETATQSELFSPVGLKTRIYRRMGDAGRATLGHFPVFATAGSAMGGQAPRLPRPAHGESNLQVLADQVLLRSFAPASVLVTTQGDIVYFNGKTGRYLEPPAGKANLNLFAMARSGLAQPMAEVFYRAVRQKSTEKVEQVTVMVDGQQRCFSVTVAALEEPAQLNGMLMVVFQDLPPHRAGQADSGDHGRVTELLQELTRAREEHQATREEMQTSQEKLKSANEELQSANEELTTSREEMQSMNEELQTVNSELQARVDALGRASDDMENLLNSTDIATLFLDKALHVRRFTNRATSIIKLIPSDIGRPITDLVTELQHDQLATDAQEVLRTLIFREAEVQASGERWFRVRIMPYRTQDNRIDGVVITFTDISASKRLEGSLRQQSKPPG